MTGRILSLALALGALLCLAPLLTGCGSVKKVAGGVGNAAGKLRFWKGDDKSSDYTLADGGAAAAEAADAEEQMLIDAAQEAARVGQLNTETPDRIDLNRTAGLEEEPGSPAVEKPADRFSTAPAYGASSRATPPATSNFGPGSPGGTPANTGIAVPPLTEPEIPAPREKDEGYIRLLPEPRYPSAETIVPPGG